MSHDETQPLTGCVSVSQAVRPSPTVETLGAEPPTNSHQIGESHPSAGVPVLRGPGDVFHTEAYLISWLVRCHGWRVVEPGLLRRVTGLERSITLPHNREAGRQQLRQLRGAA